MTEPATSQRIKEIEGLRGLMAWWVVIIHITNQSGIFSYPSVFNIFTLQVGDAPVDVFVIISGFSIFCLFEKSKENYGIYLIRRFFRLYPVYICCFLAGILVIGLENQNLDASKSFFYPYLWTYFKLRNTEVLTHVIPNILAHVTMVHGLLPRSVLPSSSLAFLPPAWVISLEWQFYLIAPLLLYCIKKGKTAIFGLLCAVLVAFCWRQNLPKIDHDACLPFFVEYFGLGILSFYVYKFIRENKNFFRSFFQVFPVAASIFIIFLNIKFLKFPSLGYIIPLSIWLVFFVFLIEATLFSESKPGKIFSSFFTSAVMQYLGKLSYSTYNVHIIIIVIVQYVLLHMFHVNSRASLCVTTFILSVPLTMISSHYCYKYIEAPGSQLGNFLKKRLTKKEKVR